MTLLEEFLKAVSQHTGQPSPNISFVGMSNIGKTHWSTLLASYTGIERIDFDDLIGDLPLMAKLIANEEGKDNAAKMGNYFGMPWDKGFEERESIFLRGEQQVMEKYTDQSGLIYDLTGSAFLHETEMKKISESGLVIYVEASPEEQEQALEGLLKDFEEGPKPVCWGKATKPNNEEEFRECFRKLLSYRAKKYAEHADITIPYKLHNRHTGILKTAEDFMRCVLDQLKETPSALQTRQPV